MLEEQLYDVTSGGIAVSTSTNVESGERREAREAADSSIATASEPEPATTPREIARAPEEPDRPTLVIVDDESDVLSSLYNLLRMEYRVVTFDYAADALEFLRADPAVEVILSDQRMPEMTGVEVLRQARMIRPATTRLLFTAYSDIRTVIAAINEGHIFRYLAKGCEPDEILLAVRQAVEHHRLIVEKNRLLADLQETNQKLNEADQVKEAFIQVASHELNTPLTVVLGILELWRMSQSPAASPRERDWVDRITAAAGRLAHTVERMLKLVRNRDFGQTLDYERLEIEPAARRAIEELSPYLEMRRLSVLLDVEPGLAPIDADAAKISDVLINLLANAIKFSPDGGTILLAARAEPSAGDSIRVQVTDQGAGISPAEQQHLFEPFFTGFDTLRHSSGDYQFGKRGIGLGLWLVKTFVELHKGRVEVSSTPGAGSTFAFVIPRSPTGAPP
jgi:signal transduction histidine kinase